MHRHPANARTSQHSTPQGAAHASAACPDACGDAASSTADAVYRTAGRDGAMPSTAGRFHIRASRIAA
ncbi:MAG: hypothetical protein ACTIJY_05605 [Luteimonas sp.]